MIVAAIDHIAIYMLDPEGRILSWNEGGTRNKGYSEEEIIGSHFSIFFDSADVDRGEPERILREAAFLGRVEIEGWRLRKDGRRIWISAYLRAVRNLDGELLGYVKVTRNESAKLSQRLELERERDKAQAERRLTAERLAESSHEMRNALNSIVGFAESMETLMPTMSVEQQLEYIKIIRSTSNDLIGICNTTLNGIAAENNLKASINLADFRRLCLRVMREFDLTKIVQIPKLVRDDDGERSIRADEAAVKQVLRNLFGNAIKHGGGKQNVEVRIVLLDNDYVQVCVDDAGPGIPEPERDRVFDRYFRGQSNAEGAGLGLAVCRELIHQMNGEIGVAQSPLGGARFWFSLRRVDAESNAPATPTTLDSDAELSSNT